MIFEDGPIRRQLGFYKVMRVGPWSNGVGLLINEDEIPELSPSLSAFVHRKVHVIT